MKGSSKGERMLSAILFTGTGAAISIYEIYFTFSAVVYPTVIALTSLLPAILLYSLDSFHTSTPKEMKSFLKKYSIFSLILALFILISKLVDSLDFMFAAFVLPGFIAILYAYFKPGLTQRAGIMRFGAIWLSIGFFSTFFYFVSNFIPHVADDEHLWKNGGVFANWYFIKGVFAIV
jgi:uncharacterized integral membrane protein